MIEKQKAVIFDIDGVLAEKSEKRGYREYDKVHLDYMIKCGFSHLEWYVKNDYKIIIITGRKEYCRDLTIEWIDNHLRSRVGELGDGGYYTIEADRLYFRPDNDHQPAHSLKKEICEKNEIFKKYNVVRIFEDDPEVVKMYINDFQMRLEGDEYERGYLAMGNRKIYILS